MRPTPPLRQAPLRCQRWRRSSRRWEKALEPPGGAIPLRVHSTEKGAALVHFLRQYMQGGDGQEHWFMASVKSMSGHATTQHDVVV